MTGGRVGKFFLLALLAAVVAAVVKALRGDPAPVFASHPSVDDGEVTSGPRGGSVYDTWASPLAEEPEPPAAASDAAATAPDDRPALSVVPDPEPVPEAAVVAAEAIAAAARGAGPAWVVPVDGECPDGYPVKAKKSGVFRVPGSPGYEASNPDRCYPTAEAAEADGLHQATR
jgi:hypothetical protein